MNLELSPLADADLERLVALDEECFPGEPFARSWWHKALTGQGAAAWVVREGQALRAYCLFSRVLDEAELLRIAVAPQARRQGVAQRLLAQAQSALERDGICRFHLEVRQSNQPAQQLYRALDWQLTGMRAGYYPAAEGREDACLFGRTVEGVEQP